VKNPRLTLEKNNHIFTVATFFSGVRIRMKPKAFAKSEKRTVDPVQNKIFRIRNTD
jgi:hypothetical protein